MEEKKVQYGCTSMGIDSGIVIVFKTTPRQMCLLLARVNVKKHLDSEFATLKKDNMILVIIDKCQKGLRVFFLTNEQ